MRQKEYRKNRLSNFYNQIRSNERQMTGFETGFLNLAFTVLVMYMQSCYGEVFYLSEVRKNINDRLQQLQGDGVL